MPLSGEMFGEDHPATYSPEDPNNPNYDPETAKQARKDRIAQELGHVGELPGEMFGEDQSGFFVPGKETLLGDGPIDNVVEGEDK